MDTIAAIATAQGAAGIGIVRVSGDKAIETAQKIFKAKEPLAKIQGYTAILGKIVDKVEFEGGISCVIQITK